MFKLRLLAATGAIAVATAIAPAVATAAPAPAPIPVASANVVVFQIPAIGGIEWGPGQHLRPISINARRAPTTLQYPAPPRAVEFSVARIVPYYYQNAVRYLSISWRNVNTGKTGRVNLREWPIPKFKYDKLDSYPATLPTSAIAQTGAGIVVASVSLIRDDYNHQQITTTLIPGFTTLSV
ncbi:hypothetical protein GOEFS_106_00900 [Gordonia effusa NBRC 100432]|uniref:Secreted protein n=1 Tax=Gordonia effusa NBRC 100432 TaxID=1077974 RepID=H0R542_9ACTN|nr:hypothetical protein [Gordonia effusa]GAB20193.1 hypothetical protein GOEFS_106_00900 [Gordonia effusa NBRC 100432]